jgi:hypothetical protein
MKNYRFFSVELVACGDADGLFAVDVGGVVKYKAHFHLLILCHWLEMEGFYLTDLARLTSNDSSEPLPCFFVGREAFQLQKILMRLYS